ncbi:MAG: hypothetical protein NVS2B9_01080 [Myxococcales bacterium]
MFHRARWPAALGAAAACFAAQTGCGNDGGGTFASRRTGLAETEAASERIPNQKAFANSSGEHATYSTRDGRFLETSNAFFRPLGSNGRACSSCHEAESGFSVSAARIQERFDESDGDDPIFRVVDGSNSPRADVSTIAAKRAAFSLLLKKGLIRVTRAIPPTAQFELVSVDDPYGNDTSNGISVFRRPLPSTNLKFVNPIMWDGREPDLLAQARTATLVHAEAAVSPDDATLKSIVEFESALFTTQVVSLEAGSTSADGATGDPVTLSMAPFFFRQNSCNPALGPIVRLDGSCGTDPHVFKMFVPWAAKAGGSSPGTDSDAKAAVARGQEIFNTKPFFDPRSGPAGANVSCANCHNHPQSGGFTIPKGGPPFGGFPTVEISSPRFRTPDLPLYTFRVKATGALVKSTDPGAALTTGLMRDFNRFKSTQLRGLASHAPYFHNGVSATLGDVVDLYDAVFKIGYTTQERSDLIAFLGSI